MGDSLLWCVYIILLYICSRINLPLFSLPSFPSPPFPPLLLLPSLPPLPSVLLCIVFIALPPSFLSQSFLLSLSPPSPLPPLLPPPQLLFLFLCVIRTYVGDRVRHVLFWWRGRGPSGGPNSDETEKAALPGD